MTDIRIDKDINKDTILNFINQGFLNQEQYMTRLILPQNMNGPN